MTWTDAPTTAQGCKHGPRSLTFPGGHATLTLNGNWAAYFDAKPGEVFSLVECPGCRVALWGLAGAPKSQNGPSTSRPGASPP